MATPPTRIDDFGTSCEDQMDQKDANVGDQTPPAPRRQSAALMLARWVRDRPGEFAFNTVTAFLIAIPAYAAFVNVAAKGWNADAAAWAQAFGSIVAVVSAGWLARNETRQLRRESRRQGEETAWAVRFVIAQAQFDAQIVAAELTRHDKKWESDDIRSWQQRTRTSELALTALLTKTDYLHPSVVLSVSNAKVLVEQLQTDLERLEALSNRGARISDSVIGDIVCTHINLSTLLTEYDARMRGISEALDRGRDVLPIYELRSE